MITTLEVVDTAVKVGLGALLTAGGGYLLARVQHTQGVAKETNARRRAHLEEINLKFVRHLAALRRCELALIPYWSRGLGEVERKEAGAVLLVAIDELSVAIGTAELIGEQEVAGQLRWYASRAAALSGVTGDSDTTVTPEEWDARFKEVDAARLVAINALSRAYLKIG